MGNRNKIILVSMICAILAGCSAKKDKIVGTYVARNTVNTIDTVVIKEDGTYINTLYRASDKVLVYKNTGTWKLSGSYLTFDDFYMDNDDIHDAAEANFQNALMTQGYQIEEKSGKVIIHHIAMYQNMYLERLD